MYVSADVRHLQEEDNTKEFIQVQSCKSKFTCSASSFVL